jgi:hypothetical protein
MVVVRSVNVYGLARSQMRTVVVVEGCRRICFAREFWRREKADRETRQVPDLDLYRER